MWEMKWGVILVDLQPPFSVSDFYYPSRLLLPQKFHKQHSFSLINAEAEVATHSSISLMHSIKTPHVLIFRVGVGRRELMEQELRLKWEAVESAFEAQAEKDRTLMRLEELRFLATSTKDLDDDDAYWIKKQKRFIRNKMRNDLGDEDDEDE
uniref:Uncharacterized protein n=1 Tax=Tanacetum cinerariifolium TaxID=118510 RepID=A0A6L2PA30_TANCI|nr:hypothetical protein [Tanacetum cinerariifolium]